MLNCNISFFIFFAKEWAQNVGRPCTMKEAGSLRHKFLILSHFLGTDFMTPEGRNRLLMKARRRRTAMRKMKMLSHT
jgi:hypothetical protein